MSETLPPTDAPASWQERTIVALASPVGVGALAIIRLSGPQALPIFSRCARGKMLQPRLSTYCKIYNAEGHVLDELMACYYAAPASFTGEDTVEIICHGGMLVVRRLLEALLAAGAQPAEPGEFSRRAFENGKMDLTQAEAVMDVIAASSDLALRAAHNQLGGAISRKVSEAIEALIHTLAHIEAYIDFPEEDIEPSSLRVLQSQVAVVEGQLTKLLSSADEGRLLREGIKTVLVGAPNAGKSSLLNRLLGYQRAIISDIAGTTRDTIEEQVNLGALSLRLIDTAGIHESKDIIEKQGIQRSRQAGAEADLLIEIADASQAPQDLQLQCSPHTKHILVLNKIDLEIHPAWQKTPYELSLSCLQDKGIKELEKCIEQLFFTQEIQEDNFAAINMRHRQAIQEALKALALVQNALEMQSEPELISLDLRDALNALGSITGKVDIEEVLGAIFTQFCLGK